MNKETQKKHYFAHKALLEAIRDNVTIKRWKVLSKAYKEGKRIWGSRFTRVRLAHDMEVPFTTVLRCLALDRANKRTWDLINQKKISAFKVAQICMSKNITYQDEIVDMVIADNLSTYQIKNLKIKSLADVTTERLRIATRNGFSRKDSAYRSFQIWVTRGKELLLMDKKHLPETRLEELHSNLIDIKSSIERYLG